MWYNNRKDVEGQKVAIGQTKISLPPFDSNIIEKKRGIVTLLTIYCALFSEAQEIIKRFQLKKETRNTHFQVFSDTKEEIRLVLTGVGAIAAATAVAELSGCYSPKQTDLLLNFGSCAARDEVPIGKVFVCNKLTEECSGRTFYPDMLYHHPFLEAELISEPKIKTLNERKTDCTKEMEWKETRLYDMEAAAVYQAGNYYYGPHQMIFLKVVSDHGCKADKKDEKITDMQAQMRALMQDIAEPVSQYIETLCKICHTKKKESKTQAMFRRQAEEAAEKLREQLHCSFVMQTELLQLLLYWKLTGTDDTAIFDEYRRQGRLPAKDKREGKKILDELKERL